jgi:alkylhydroperoxidase/carboxymuconolactone decarboxylase family protein YurZ
MVKTPVRLSAAQRSLKARVIEERGSWNPLWDQLLVWDPEFFEAYFNFSAVPWRRSVLPPKVKELIYIAVDASTTHLYAPGLRRHIRNALKLGATREEILEVLELISVLGIHACNLGVPMLAEELESLHSTLPRKSAPRRQAAKKRR